MIKNLKEKITKISNKKKLLSTLQKKKILKPNSLEELAVLISLLKDSVSSFEEYALGNSLIQNFKSVKEFERNLINYIDELTGSNPIKKMESVLKTLTDFYRDKENKNGMYFALNILLSHYLLNDKITYEEYKSFLQKIEEIAKNKESREYSFLKKGIFYPYVFLLKETSFDNYAKVIENINKIKNYQIDILNHIKNNSMREFIKTYNKYNEEIEENMVLSFGDLPEEWYYSVFNTFLEEDEAVIKEKIVYDLLKNENLLKEVFKKASQNNFFLKENEEKKLFDEYFTKTLDFLNRDFFLDFLDYSLKEDVYFDYILSFKKYIFNGIKERSLTNLKVLEDIYLKIKEKNRLLANYFVINFTVENLDSINSFFYKKFLSDNFYKETVSLAKEHFKNNLKELLLINFFLKPKPKNLADSIKLVDTNTEEAKVFLKSVSFLLLNGLVDFDYKKYENYEKNLSYLVLRNKNLLPYSGLNEIKFIKENKLFSPDVNSLKESIKRNISLDNGKLESKIVKENIVIIAKIQDKIINISPIKKVSDILDRDINKIKDEIKTANFFFLSEIANLTIKSLNKEKKKMLQKEINRE